MPDEGEDPALAQEACQQQVDEVGTDLKEYSERHPVNHGMYVSFTAHCLKAMKGKGQMMRQVAQASGSEQGELAVRLCSEYRAQQAEMEADGLEQTDVAGVEETNVAGVEGTERQAGPKNDKPEKGKAG